jgi:hypothetical protein
MMTYIRLLLSLVVLYFVGYPFYRLINPPETRNEKRINSILIPFILGLGFLPLFLFYLSFAGFELNNQNIAIIWIFFSALSFLLMLLHKRKGKKQEIKREKSECQKEKLKPITILLCLVIMVAIAFAFFYSLSKPLDTHDALYHWGYKAKVLYFERTIKSSSFTDFSGSIVRIQTHPDYPLLVPFLEFHISVSIGKYDDRLIKALFPFSFLLLILLYWRFNRKFFSLDFSLLSTIFIISIPLIYYQEQIRSILPDYQNVILGGNADLPLALFYTASSFYLFQWIKNRHFGDILMAALFSSFGCFTKNEGLMLISSSWLALIIITIFCFKKNRNKGLMGAAIFLTLSFVLILSWIIYQSGLPHIAENYPQQMRISIIMRNLSRLPEILFYLVKEFGRVLLWGSIWILFFTTLILTRKEKMDTGIKFLSLAILINTLLIIGIYIITPWELENILRLRVTSRLLLQMAPVVIFITFYQIHAFMNKKNHKSINS